jgi:hypothetical protein
MSQCHLSPPPPRFDVAIAVTGVIVAMEARQIYDLEPRAVQQSLEGGIGKEPDGQHAILGRYQRVERRSIDRYLTVRRGTSVTVRHQLSPHESVFAVW